MGKREKKKVAVVSIVGGWPLRSDGVLDCGIRQYDFISAYLQDRKKIFIYNYDVNLYKLKIYFHKYIKSK